MYKQNIPEHARTIRNIHNGLTSGQKLFFGPTRSWGEPCGQAAFKGETRNFGPGRAKRGRKFWTKKSEIWVKNITPLPKFELDFGGNYNPLPLPNRREAPRKFGVFLTAKTVSLRGKREVLVPAARSAAGKFLPIWPNLSWNSGKNKNPPT